MGNNALSRVNWWFLWSCKALGVRLFFLWSNFSVPRMACVFLQVPLIPWTVHLRISIIQSHGHDRSATWWWITTVDHTYAFSWEALCLCVVHLFVYLVYCLFVFVWLSFPAQGVKGTTGGMASPTGVAGRWFSSLGWAWLATLPCRVSRARARRTWSMPGNPVFGFWAANFHLLQNMSSNCR